MKWITRERPKIDRIACPWLVARFIDKEPEFLYVPSGEVLKIAHETGAIPCDIPEVELGHVGKLCSFDAFLKKYNLTDSALKQLAGIVRGADTSRLDLAPQSARVYAISPIKGASVMNITRCKRYCFAISTAFWALAICYFSIESRVLASNRVKEASRTSYGDILNKHQGGGHSALRAREDVTRHRLWVLDLDHVYLYDTTTRKLVHQVPLRNWPVANFICPPDLVVDQAGTAFVSNNVQPRLLRIDAATMRQHEYQLKLVSPKHWEIGFGGLAVGVDGTMFALSALAGALFKIDLGSASAREIPLIAFG